MIKWLTIVGNFSKVIECVRIYRTELTFQSRGDVAIISQDKLLLHHLLLVLLLFHVAIIWADSCEKSF